MTATLELVELPRWRQTQASVLDAAAKAASATLRESVESARQFLLFSQKTNSKQPVPVAKPPNAPLTAPPERVRDEFGNANQNYVHNQRPNEWFETIVATLRDSKWGWGLEGEVDEVEPARLLRALEASNIGTEVSSDRVVVGFAGRSELDAATRYNAKLLIRPGINPFRTDDKNPAKPQLLWWNWDKQKWDSASVIASSDGSVRIVPDTSGNASGISRWRGSIEPGTGYWADVEFGTQLRQVPSQFVPKKGESLIALYVGQGKALALPTDSGGLGVKPRLFLSETAVQLIGDVRSPKKSAEYTQAVRRELSNRGHSG